MRYVLGYHATDDCSSWIASLGSLYVVYYEMGQVNADGISVEELALKCSHITHTPSLVKNVNHTVGNNPKARYCNRYHSLR